MASMETLGLGDKGLSLEDSPDLLVYNLGQVHFALRSLFACLKNEDNLPRLTIVLSLREIVYIKFLTQSLALNPKAANVSFLASPSQPVSSPSMRSLTVPQSAHSLWVQHETRPCEQTVNTN